MRASFRAVGLLSCAFGLVAASACSDSVSVVGLGDDGGSSVDSGTEAGAPPVDASSPDSTVAQDGAASPDGSDDGSTSDAGVDAGVDAPAGASDGGDDASDAADAAEVGVDAACGPLACVPPLVDAGDAGPVETSCSATCGTFAMGCSCAAPDQCFCNVGNAAPSCAYGSLAECGYPNTCAADLGSDPNNCGRCGHSCGGRACIAGVCQPDSYPIQQPVASDAPTDWVTEGTNFYIASCGSDLVYSTPVGGLGDGGAPTIYSSGQSCPIGVSIDANDNLYWVADQGSTVWMSPIPSPSPTKLGTTSPAVTWGSGGGLAHHALTGDLNYLYFVVQPSSGPGSVFAAPKTGGTPIVLCSDANVGSGVVAADNTNVYFFSYGGATTELRAVSKTGGAGQASRVITTFTGGAQNLDMIATSSGKIYCVGGGSVIYTVSPNVDGGVATIFYDGHGSGQPVSLATDGATLFWTDFTGYVYDKPFAGGAAQRIWQTGREPYLILADAGYVYWTMTSELPNVLRLPKSYQP